MKEIGGKLNDHRMKIYLRIDMAKDKFDYCAMGNTLNILCWRSNKENESESFNKLYVPLAPNALDMCLAS